MLDRGADVGLFDKAGNTALALAIEKEDLKIAALLSLHRAAEQGDIEAVRRHLDRGATVDSQDEKGWTALMFASAWGHKELASVLLSDGGAKVNLQSKGSSAHCVPGAKSSSALQHRRIGMGPSPSSSGNSALMLASFFGRSDVAALLLDRGARIDLRDKHDETALMWAARWGHVEVVRLLLARGAECNLQNVHGETALMWASSEGHEAAVSLLLECGASVSLANRIANETALMMAVSRGHARVSALLQSAAEREARRWWHCCIHELAAL